MKHYRNLFNSIKVQIIFYICLLTTIPLLFVCIVEYYSSKNAIEQRVIEQLTSIADLKKRELNNWLEERLTDTSVIARNKVLAAASTSLLQQRRRFDSVSQLIKSETAGINYKRVLENLHALKQFYKHYNVISIIDGANGEIVLSTYPDIVGKTVKYFNKYIDTLEQKEVDVRDVYTSELTDQNCMTYFCPVCLTDPFTLESSDVIIGVILLDVDVKNSIEPLIRNWPGMGNTGETLLVRKEENNIVYLNNLRHKEDAGLKLVCNINSTPDIPSILSASGEEGIKESMDYRNVSVLSAYRYIPTLNWGLVAKQDLTEAFAPVEQLKMRIIVLILVCTTVVIAIGISLTNRITQPILQLAEGAKAIGSGNLDHRISITSQNEVGALAKEFNQMATKLKESYSNLEQKVEERTAQLLRAERLAAVGELAAEVAHEINNPLGGLGNFASMLENEPENTQQTKKYAALILEGLKRVEIIVKRLLTFSRPYSLQMSDKNINSIINNSIKFIEYRIEPCHITIKKDLNETIPYVYIDADNISQVLINIMVNALESMPDGGTLTIKTDTCKEHDSCVTVYIADTGCGIREELKDKIFKPFFTTKNKEGEKGLGMGLAISKRIIEDHHGKINVESEIGKGTTFSVCIPCRKG
ncbi:MAG TPA: sensor histidine kinase [Candidatus Wujingus californicus]|uniref:sensor histidine kinase n=1 Tax=Candidatus Wujingus californicus TaxID=3367618 RepID=UPI001D3E6FFA|nr:HAMP domain-containing protein [Planctomycetota bacterium]MDO8132028.1 ATP-binding protein [Candidatus Brocadiales bacterium]